MVGSRLTLLDKLNLFVGVYAQMFLGIFRFSWWSPFFLYSLFQLAGFFALVWYYAVVSMVNVIYGSVTTVVVALLSVEVVALILLLSAQVIAELERGPDESAREKRS